MSPVSVSLVSGGVHMSYRMKLTDCPQDQLIHNTSTPIAIDVSAYFAHSNARSLTHRRAMASDLTTARQAHNAIVLPISTMAVLVMLIAMSQRYFS